MTIFFRILDIPNVNARVLCKSYIDSNETTRINFMKDLAHKLVLPEIERRIQNKIINREIKSNIRLVLGIQRDLSNT